jgi:hypothetical protein
MILDVVSSLGHICCRDTRCIFLWQLRTIFINSPLLMHLLFNQPCPISKHFLYILQFDIHAFFVYRYLLLTYYALFHVLSESCTSPAIKRAQDLGIWEIKLRFCLTNEHFLKGLICDIYFYSCAKHDVGLSMHRPCIYGHNDVFLHPVYKSNSPFVNCGIIVKTNIWCILVIL